MTYDLVVIGAGMAGITAARHCARAGWRVAIVDELPYGGTCALRGCDPKKILRRGAEIVEDARLLEGRGIRAAGLAIDWPALMAHKRGFTDPVPARMERSLTRAGVTTLHGPARFTGPATLRVDGTELAARRFLIATGARPRPLDFDGAGLVIDSTGFLNLERMVDRILFIGGGFVSFEFAHIAARAGAEVTVVDRGPRPLKAFDPDLVDRLVDRSRTVGVEVRTHTTVGSVRRSGSGFRVELRTGDTSEVVDVDLVVHGAGRVPNLDHLDPSAASIETGPRGVVVHPHLQSTSNPAVWAAGDAADTPGPPLTPVAVLEGQVAAANMIGDRTDVPDYRGVPTVVFTIPELARVGMLEQEAADAGIDVDVRFHDTSRWFSNYRVGERTAATKILVNRADRTVVGAHLLGPGYAEVINLLAVAMRLGLTTDQLSSVVTAYPTVGADLASML